MNFEPPSQSSLVAPVLSLCDRHTLTMMKWTKMDIMATLLKKVLTEEKTKEQWARDQTGIYFRQCCKGDAYNQPSFICAPLGLKVDCKCRFVYRLLVALPVFLHYGCWMGSTWFLGGEQLVNLFEASPINTFIRLYGTTYLPLYACISYGFHIFLPNRLHHLGAIILKLGPMTLGHFKSKPPLYPNSPL